MVKPLKVLILEDRWQDATLMARALEETGYEVEWERVDTEEDYRTALESRPDVVLADYQVPGCDAMSALSMLRSGGSTAPFIVVTGTLGDEAAAACLRAGVTDYILKDRLARIGPAVEAALGQAKLVEERGRILAALRESEHRFRSVFEQCPIGLAIMGEHRVVEQANPALCDMLGMSRLQVEGRAFDDLVAPGSVDAFRTASGMLAEGAPPVQRTRCRFARPDLTPCWGDVSLSVLTGVQPAGDHILAIVEDITLQELQGDADRRRDAILSAVGSAAELFLGADEWNQAVDGSLKLIAEACAAARGRIVATPQSAPPRVLHAWCRQGLRSSAADAALAGWIERLVDRLPITPGRAVRIAPRAGEDGAPWLVVPIHVRQARWGCLCLQRPAGSDEWIDAEIAALHTAADLIGDAVQDRESAQALRASEERTRLIVQTALDAVITVDGAGTITGWNPRASEWFGWTDKEALGRQALATLAPPYAHQEWIDAGLTVGAEQAATPATGRRRTTALRKDGTEFPAEVAVSSAEMNGTVMFSVFLRDITQQRISEEALEEARRHDDMVAARIQRSLLVGDPPVTSPRLAAACLTVPGQIIAGDFVANLRHDEETLDLIVGDVMGKGVNAALLGAITKGNIHQAARHLMLQLAEFNRLPEPHEIVTAVHEHMSHELAELESFVTLSYARYDLRHWRCTVVDCGHTRSLHFRREQADCERLKGENLPLGIADREFFEPIYVSIEPGDLFFTYSDGVMDAEAPDGELFGEERVVNCVAAARHLSPQEIVKKVCDEVMAFCHRATPIDDITCMAVSIGDAPPPRAGFRRVREVAGDLDQLEPVREFVRAFCHAMPGPPLRPEAVDNLMLAAHEAACNVIIHAHQGRPDMRVQILAEAYDDMIELRFYDTGVGFALNSVQSPRIDLLEERGYGIYLIQQLVDQVDYRRDELGRNYLFLAKRRTADQDNAPRAA